MIRLETAKTNHLLGAMPPEVWARLVPHLTPINLALGEVLYESGKEQFDVFFPTTAVVSMLYVLANGSSAEIAIVGNEGLIGVSLFMGGESTPSRAVVQVAGCAFRITAEFIRDEFHRAGPAQQLFLRYTQALLTQMTQTAACNRHHKVEQQLCRWLLMSLDRLDSDVVCMTQQLIADMLGVRRVGVGAAAARLQRAGVIEYGRGRITVLDRPRLERIACECYEVVRKEYQRLLPWRHHRQQARNQTSRSSTADATQWVDRDRVCDRTPSYSRSASYAASKTRRRCMLGTFTTEGGSRRSITPVSSPRYAGHVGSPGRLGSPDFTKFDQ